jgi:hypothetical protein
VTAADGGAGAPGAASLQPEPRGCPEQVAGRLAQRLNDSPAHRMTHSTAEAEA